MNFGGHFSAPQRSRLESKKLFFVPKLLFTPFRQIFPDWAARVEKIVFQAIHFPILVECKCQRFIAAIESVL